MAHWLKQVPQCAYSMSVERGEIQTIGKAVFVVIISAIILDVLFSSLKMY